MALATIQDLTAVMARDLSGTDLPRAQRLLEIASARVRTFTGQTFEYAETTDRLPVRNRKVRLPQRPVIDVSAVTDINDVAISFEWLGGNVVDIFTTVLNEWEIEPRRTRLRAVKVTYEHGYEAVPDDVVGIVCDMTAAALDSPPEQVGVQTETIGPASVSYGSQLPGGVRLTQSMRDALLPYCAPVGTAQVA